MNTPDSGEVLHLRATGMTYREISQVLGVTPEQVRDAVEASIRSWVKDKSDGQADGD